MLIDRVKELNKISLETETEKKNKADYFCRFYFGDKTKLLFATIKTLAYGEKVAFICSKENAIESKKLVSIAGIGTKCQIIGCMVDVSANKTACTSNNIEKISSAIGGVKVIIALDDRLFNLATYVAMINAIPLVLVPDKIGFEDILCSTLFIKENYSYKRAKVKAIRYVILDKNVIDNADIQGIFYRLISLRANAIDYRISCLLRGENEDERAIELLKSATVNAYPVFTTEGKWKIEELIFLKFLAELSNIASNGEMEKNSAVKITEEILKMRGYYGESVSKSIFSKIIGVYDLYFCGKYDGILEVPDYLERADRLSDISGCVATEFLKNFLTQRNAIEEKKKQLSILRRSLKTAVAEQKKFADRMTTLFDKTDRIENLVAIDNAIRIAGDLPNTFNAMTLLRESGITEYFGSSE